MLRKFGNSLFWTQNVQIRLDDISEHFYQKMHSYVAFLCNLHQTNILSMTFKSDRSDVTEYDGVKTWVMNSKIACLLNTQHE